MFEYLITDPEYYPDNNFNNLLNITLKKHIPKFACFRDKREIQNKDALHKFSDICAKYSVISALNGSIEDALKYQFSCVHLTSKQYEFIPLAKKQNLICIASCHSRSEALFCLQAGADYVTLSPVFASPNKSAPIGIDGLKEYSIGIENRVIALGGIIDNAQIELLKTCNVVGYASIRRFI